MPDIEKKDRVYIGDLHFDHTVWTKELDFYSDEINIFENRLEEISQRWTNNDVLAHLERFQNQYIRQKEVIDTLKHDIKIQEQGIANFAKDHPVAIDHVHFHDHDGMRDRMETFRKIYMELKVDFYAFVRKYM
ncbi:MAG: hypothetical protein GYB31_08995 [Bacteroidetes bacterium]|nr:hypothetical protein [Bacteroidota bacterium]